MSAELMQLGQELIDRAEAAESLGPYLEGHMASAARGAAGAYREAARLIAACLVGQAAS